MKLLMGALVLFSGFAAQNYVQAEPISNCLGKLEAGAQALSWLPSSYKEDVISNLDYYQTLAVRAMKNAKAKQSNKQVLSAIHTELRKQREASELGAYTANCLAPHLEFTGTSEQQYKMANFAFQKIQAARNVVSK